MTSLDSRTIVGHIRFSYYGRTDTRLRPDESGESITQLYDETRMARRFYLFEKLTIPSLLAQSDKRFSLVVMSSDLMPIIYKDRLTDVMSCIPETIVDFSSEREGHLAFKPYMNAALGGDMWNSAIHFRLDDDDALAKGYIHRLRRAAAHLRPGTCISFPTGVLVFPVKRGEPSGQSLVTTVFLTAIGLAVISDKNNLKNPFQMGHTQVWQDRPVFSDPNFIAYIRAQHFDNDTLQRQDKLLQNRRLARLGNDAHAHERAVERALKRGFPFLSREQLDSTIPEVYAIQSMADLPPVGSFIKTAIGISST
jgi:Putative rhamnosyl transferase